MRALAWVGLTILAADVAAFAWLWWRGRELAAGLFAPVLVLVFWLGAGLFLIGLVGVVAERFAARRGRAGRSDR